MLVACAALTLLVPAAPVQARLGERVVTYAPDDADFPNPERGFSASKGSGADARAAGLSLVHVYVRLDAFRDRPLPRSLLDQLRARFAEARASGVKLVPRFTYNFPGSAYTVADQDAPLPRVLEHIDQLAPLLRANADVIAFLEAGFIGAWGEWHDSTSSLDALPAKRAILARLLQALPAGRDIALRYERDKRAILARDAPISPVEAFTGAPVARLGHHNDCFLASPDDEGTYVPTPDRPVAAAKAYLAADNLYAPQGGETCSDGPAAQPYVGCANGLRELAAQHWSQLNADYHRGVLDRWKREGCYGQIARRLGYRFALLRSAYPPIARRGARLHATITLVNQGFAAPYNPRTVQLVLRGADGAVVRLTLAADPRRWLPGAPIAFVLARRLPSTMRPGLYEAALALPDPAPRLRSNPAYGIRLANRGLWNAATGENALHWRIAIR